MTQGVKKQSATKKQNPRVKPREKLQEFGVKNLTNVELLSLILGSGTPKLPVFTLAHAILKTFPLSKLASISLTELITLSGLGSVKAGRVLAALEFGKRSLSLPTFSKILTPTEALPHFDYLRHKKREHVVCLYLNGRHELVHQETVAVGGLNYSLLEPRDIFGPALKIPAPYIILGHNHPSGSPKPSQEDLSVTKKLQQAGELLGVTLLDHVIIGQKSHISLKNLERHEG